MGRGCGHCVAVTVLIFCHHSTHSHTTPHTPHHTSITPQRRHGTVLTYAHVTRELKHTHSHTHLEEEGILLDHHCVLCVMVQVLVSGLSPKTLCLSFPSDSRSNGGSEVPFDRLLKAVKVRVYCFTTFFRCSGFCSRPFPSLSLLSYFASPSPPLYTLCSTVMCSVRHTCVCLESAILSSTKPVTDKASAAAVLLSFCCCPQDVCAVPDAFLHVFLGTRRLEAGTTVPHGAVCRVAVGGGLKGGKGGFGAMLRASGKGRGQRVEDFGACRDLSGRR